MKRVALITEYFYPDMSGSTPALLSELFQKISEETPEVKIEVITSDNFYRRNEKHVLKTEEWGRITIKRVSSDKTRCNSLARRLYNSMKFLFSTIKLTLKGNYDVVFLTSNPPTVPFMGLFVRFLNKKTRILYIIHDLHPDEGIKTGQLNEKSMICRLSRFFQYLFLKYSDRVFVVGRCMKQYIENQYGISPEKIILAPNWSSATCAGPATLPTLGPIRITYLGNVGICQDFDGFLAAAQAFENDPRFVFIIAGDGARSELIQTKVANSRNLIVNRRSYSKEQYLKALGKAHLSVICLGEDLEGIAVPSKIYEYLSFGKPILFWGPSGCEAARIIKEYNCGSVFQKGTSVATVVERILGIVNEPETYSIMSRNALQAAGYFSLERTASIILEQIE